MAISSSSNGTQRSVQGIPPMRDRWWWTLPAGLFGWSVRLRHWMFDAGLRSSRKGALPTVVMGNITVGGTGKTPHVGALLQALGASDPGRKWGILSRGYGRQTKGFLEVDKAGSPAEFGDEPLELARRFPANAVAVSEDRLAGLEAMQAAGGVDAVLLDDGFQHRRLSPTYAIVLVDATQPVDRDHFLPRGRLRDVPSRLSAADAVIITRCEDALTKGDLRLWRHRLHLGADQLLLHTGSKIEGLRNLNTKRYASWPRRCIAVSGIAHPSQFEMTLSRNCTVTQHFAYPDHHPFTTKEVGEWKAALGADNAPPEAIITTEKDASRIRALELPEDLPILVLGMQVLWWDEEALTDLLTSIRQRVDASLAEPDI